jgi:chorismate dehydratase
LNCEPFYEGLPSPAQRLHPRALGEAVAAGSLDAGPLSLADCLRLEGSVERLQFGVAGRRGQSVFLFSLRPLAELSGAIIGVTGETSTSVRLLKILLAFRYEVRPEYTDLDRGRDAILLIGDQALKSRKETRYPHCIDLGNEWSQWTGLPFTFAAWGVRSSAPKTEREEFARRLSAALDYGLSRLPQIAVRRRDLGLADEEVIAYLQGFTYRLGSEEEKAVSEFSRLLSLLEK